MSTLLEIVTDKTDAATEAKMLKRKPSGKKVYKPHIATKIKWLMEDSVEKTVDAQMRIRNVLRWLDEQRSFDAGDTTRRARLGDLDHELAYLAIDVAEIERFLKQATQESRSGK